MFVSLCRPFAAAALVALAPAIQAAGQASPAGGRPAEPQSGTAGSTAPPPVIRVATPPPRIEAPPPIVRVAPRSEAGPHLLPAQVNVSPDGETLSILGAIGHGTADRVAKALGDAPALRSVALHSPGGDLRESERIAGMIRERGLDTSVEAVCVSGCTVILLAGRDRSATPNAVIGFHRPRPYVVTVQQQDLADARARSAYERAGVEPAFVDRVMATPFESIWTPDYETLSAARVLTRRSLGGETSGWTAAVTSREALGDLLLADELGRALSSRHPEMADAAIEAAWQARESGANDSEIHAAFRAVVIANLPLLLRSASDGQLDEYLDITLHQLTAAQRIGPEACHRLLTGRLDAGYNLPADLVQREGALLLQIVTSAQEAAPPGKSEVAGRLLDEIVSRLPAEQAAAIRNPAASPSAATSCEASISLFSAVQALPRTSRRAVQRYLFGGGADF